MPKVSVIIPNYNHAKYLPRRIESVLGQTYRDFEVLIMDDKSPDGSREVIARYASDPRVRLLFNTENSGSTFRQWNKGIREVTGEYVWFAESDDWAAPQFLERLVAVLDAHPQVGIAYCQSYVVDGEDHILGTSHADLDDVAVGRWRSDFIADGRDECARVFIYHNAICNASAALFRRQLYQAVGGADESMRLCGDWKVWVSMLLRSDLANIAEPLNYFRTHAGNVRSATRGWLSLLESMSVYTFIAESVHLDETTCARLRDRNAHAWVSALLTERSIPASVRTRAFREPARFDQHFKMRVTRQILARALRTLRTGRSWHWMQRLIGRPAGGTS